MDAFVEILLGLTLAGIVVLLVWRRHLKKKKDNMRKESLSNDECASAVDLTLFPEVKDNSEESLLIHCPACGLEVSRYAPTCPRCGHSIYLIRPLQQGAPLKRCNSLRNWAVAFFIEGEVTKRQRFSFPLLALVITTSNNCCKGS